MPPTRVPKPSRRASSQRDGQPQPQRKPTNENPSLFEDGVKAIECRPDRSRDKALIVAIQDYPEETKLSTPHEDAERLIEALRKLGFKEDNIHYLWEKSANPLRHPTRYNIIQELRWLKHGVQPGDAVVLYLAGHATQVHNDSGSEIDKKDEAFVTIDQPEPSHDDVNVLADSHARSGAALKDEAFVTVDLPELLRHGANLLVDNIIRKVLVNSLPVGSYLVAILDTCSSCTLLDLDSPRPYRQVDYPDDKDPDSRSSSMFSPHVNAIAQVLSPSRQNSLASSDLPAPPTSITGQALCQPPVPQDPRGFAYVLSIAACDDGQQAWGKDKSMISFLFDILNRYKDNPLTPRRLEKKLHKKMYKARKEVLAEHVETKGIIWDDDLDKKARDLQQPKITTWPNQQQILERPFTMLS